MGGGLGGASGEENFAGLLLSRQQLSRRWPQDRSGEG